MGEASDHGARRLDAMQLPFESQRLLVEDDGNERASHAALDARTPPEIDAEIGKHAADAAGLGIVGLRQRTDGRALALLHPIERCLQARERATDSARALGEDAGARIALRTAI